MKLLLALSFAVSMWLSSCSLCHSQWCCGESPAHFSVITKWNCPNRVSAILVHLAQKVLLFSSSAPLKRRAWPPRALRLVHRFPPACEIGFIYLCVIWSFCEGRQRKPLSKQISDSGAQGSLCLIRIVVVHSRTLVCVTRRTHTGIRTRRYAHTNEHMYGRTDVQMLPLNFNVLSTSLLLHFHVTTDIQIHWLLFRFYFTPDSHEMN